MHFPVLPSLALILPFVQLPYSFGPIHPFGVLVGIGVALGFKLAMRRARELGLDLERFEKHVFWTVAIGFVASHVLDTVFYHTEVLLTRPWELLLIYQGLSSFGGFFGGAGLAHAGPKGFRRCREFPDPREGRPHPRRPFGSLGGGWRYPHH